MHPIRQPHQPQRLGGIHRPLRDVGDQRHVLERGEGGDQVVELEDEADVFPAEPGQLALVVNGEVVIEKPDGAARRDVEPAEDVEEGGLAAAGGSEEDKELPREEVEVHIAQGIDFHLAHVVDLGQSPRPEHGRHVHACNMDGAGWADRRDSKMSRARRRHESHRTPASVTRTRVNGCKLLEFGCFWE